MFLSSTYLRDWPCPSSLGVFLAVPPMASCLSSLRMYQLKYKKTLTNKCFMYIIQSLTIYKFFTNNNNINTVNYRKMYCNLWLDIKCNFVFTLSMYSVKHNCVQILQKCIKLLTYNPLVWQVLSSDHLEVLEDEDLSLDHTPLSLPSAVLNAL